MLSPLIGITAYVEPASWRVWHDVQASLVPHRYVRHVQQAGGTAVLVPPLPPGSQESEVSALLARLDGIILTGGADVDPRRYGREAHPAVEAPRPDRDAAELAIARVTATSGQPVLGICRGMQVMAVAAGGTLDQHLPDRVGHLDHSPAAATYGSHPVSTAPGSLLAEVLGPRVDVATYHHQGVLGHPGLLATAWTDDGVVEALEDPGSSFRVGVQWHPEVGDDPRLFEALIAAARG